jgi:hypothetical protein
MSGLGLLVTQLVIGRDSVKDGLVFRIGNLRRLTHILGDESKATLKHSIGALIQTF